MFSYFSYSLISSYSTQKLIIGRIKGHNQAVDPIPNHIHSTGILSLHQQVSIIIPSFNNHVQLSNRIAVAAKATVFVLFLLHVITAPLTGRPVLPLSSHS